MIDQVITLVIAFVAYGFFIFSYQLWRCALDLFCKKRKLSGENNG